MGSVHWDVERPEDGPDDGAILTALAAALAHGEQPERVVDVVVVSGEALTSMHDRFLGDGTPTDVITFDLGRDPGEPEGTADGEVYVSLDQAREVAAERGVSLERELCLYVVHGALHLCGHDDHDPESRSAMRRAEAAVMGQLGYSPDTAPHDRD